MTIHSCSYYCQRPECIKAQRDELRERLAQPEQPEQEPVAWITEWKGVHSSGKVLDFKKHRRGGEVTHWPLYTTPPQRKPLTENELFKLWVSVPAETKDRFAFARAVEAAHGIKAKA